MNLIDFVRAMPKIELHVHLFGAIQPETLLKLAQANCVDLPATTVDGLHEWYTFTDFAHFVEIYLKIADCIRSSDDVELIAREFLAGQAAQNIVYSEVTHTPNYLALKGLTFADQIGAINRAKRWAEETYGITMRSIIDIPREVTPERGVTIAQWAASAMNDGVIALGLGGAEIGNPPEKFVEAFKYARQVGLPSVPHAGETVGPESIWGALRSLDAVRIGHGVRCVEDATLVAELRERQIPLEVCPSSNVCLHVVPDLEHHPLPYLIDQGLYITLNSDDPAMFNTTLTQEYLLSAQTFGFDASLLEKLVMNAAQVTLLSADEKDQLVRRVESEFSKLKQ